MIDALDGVEKTSDETVGFVRMVTRSARKERRECKDKRDCGKSQQHNAWWTGLRRTKAWRTRISRFGIVHCRGCRAGRLPAISGAKRPPGIVHHRPRIVPVVSPW